MKLKNVWMQHKEWPLILGEQRGEEPDKEEKVKDQSQIGEDAEADSAFDSEEWASPVRKDNPNPIPGEELADVAVRNSEIKNHLSLKDGS